MEIRFFLYRNFITHVYINLRTDLEALNAQSLEGAWMGFTGKQVIHPTQVNIVQSAFYSSSRRIEWAQEIIAAFDLHQQSGKVY